MATLRSRICLELGLEKNASEHDILSEIQRLQAIRVLSQSVEPKVQPSTAVEEELRILRYKVETMNEALQLGLQSIRHHSIETAPRVGCDGSPISIGC